MRIADVFFQALLDDKRLQFDVMRVGDKAGQTLGQRIKSNLTAANIGTGIGVALGAAMIPALRMADEYDTALDNIRVGTGATGDALTELEDSFRGAAGRVREDISITSQVIADLNTRTGATGKALEDLAVDVIEFSRVTRTDAVANVALVTRVFGDWSIATENQSETMNQLLRASQSTGLGVDRLMQTVVEFGAPLRLLGFGFEESIALLGKWEKEGVNTETMLTGLKFAVKTLAREGIPADRMAESLRQKIDAIGQSADPVTEAITLFGLRAGPDLAAAILEGRFSVDELMDTIQNGTETVDTAANDIRDLGDVVGELKNKVKLAVGPILQDFAGLTREMGNAIFILPALAGAFGRALGKMAGVTASFFEDITLGKRTGLAGAVNRAGAFVGRIFSAAFAAAQALGKALIGMFNAIPGMASVRNAVAAAGTKLGTLGGTRLATAFKIAVVAGVALLWAEVANVWNEQKGGFEAQGRSIGDSIAEQIATGAEEGLRQSREAIVKGIADLQPLLFLPFGAAFAGNAHRDLLNQLAAVDAALAEIERRRAPSGELFGPFIDGAGKAAGAAESAAKRIDDSAVLMTQGMANAWKSGNAKAVAAAKKAGRDQILAYSSALRSGWDSAQNAWDTLKDAMKNPMSRAKRIAKLEGRLASQRLAEGLNSNDPLVRAAAEQARAEIEDELVLLRQSSKKAGRDAGEGLAEGITDKKGTVERAARTSLKRPVHQALNPLSRDAYAEGLDLARLFAKGIRDGTYSVTTAALAMSTKVANILKFGSPTKEGPFSEAGGPEGWARIGVADWIRPWGSTDPRPVFLRLAERARDALATSMPPVSPAFSMPALAAAGAGLGMSAPAISAAGEVGASLTINGGIRVEVDARGASNPQAVGYAVRDAVAQAIREQAATLPVGTRS